MISAVVKERCEAFREFWNEHLGASMAYQLDGTWPSLGVIDLLTDSTRGRAEISAFEDAIVAGAAAYLAVMAHECWSLFGVSVAVEDRGYGVILRALEGPGIPKGEQVVMLLEKELQALLARGGGEIQVFNGFTRPVVPGQNIIAPFALGVFTGLSPIAQGAWREETLDSFKEHVDTVTRFLAAQCADRYGKIYPNEPIGQVAELYLNDLIFPPMLLAEDWPARSAVRGLVRFFKEYKVSVKQMREVTLNLAASGDELISHAGFAVHAALNDGLEIDGRFLTVAQSKGLYAAMLRPAMLDAREALGKAGEWSYDDQVTKEMEDRISVEMRLGFLPWIKLPAERVARAAEDDLMRDFISRCLSFDMVGARRTLDDLVAQDPGDIPIRLQGVYFSVIERNIEQATNEIRSLLSEPDAEDDWRVAHDAGLIELLDGNSAVAEKHLLRALEEGDCDNFTLSDLHNSLGWTYFTRNMDREAIEQFDRALELQPGMLVTTLNKAAALYRLSYDSAAETLTVRLANVVPFERRIFMSFVIEAFRHFQARRRPVSDTNPQPVPDRKVA